MHKIPSAYAVICAIKHMSSAIINMTRIDTQLLKRISRMQETGVSLKSISEELAIDQDIIKKLLKLLGYAPAD